MRFVKLGRWIINLDAKPDRPGTSFTLTGDDARRFQAIIEAQAVPWRPPFPSPRIDPAGPHSDGSK